MDAFGEMGEVFSEENENSEVEFNFLASSDLATQIIEGAPADVFASADEANMDNVVAEGLATDPVVFVENRLSIAVQQGNPKSIATLEDLENQDLVVALCNEGCPAGRYALEIFDAAGVTVEPDSLEADVRGVLTRVGLGEADAGLVYLTDIEADPEVGRGHTAGRQRHRYLSDCAHRGRAPGCIRLRGIRALGDRPADSE